MLQMTKHSVFWFMALSFFFFFIFFFFFFVGNIVIGLSVSVEKEN